MVKEVITKENKIREQGLITVRGGKYSGFKNAIYSCLFVLYFSFPQYNRFLTKLVRNISFSVSNNVKKFISKTFFFKKINT